MRSQLKSDDRPQGSYKNEKSTHRASSFSCERSQSGTPGRRRRNSRNRPGASGGLVSGGGGHVPGDPGTAKRRPRFESVLSAQAGRILPDGGGQEWTREQCRAAFRAGNL